MMAYESRHNQAVYSVATGAAGLSSSRSRRGQDWQPG